MRNFEFQRFFRMRFLGMLAVLAVINPTLSFADESTASQIPKPPAAAKPPQALILQKYEVPVGLFTGLYDMEKQHSRWITPREYFEKQGVEFPAGAIMTLDNTGKILTVRQTKENLELIETLGSAFNFDPPMQVNVEISAFGCSSTILSQLLAQKELTDDTIRGLGNSLVLLDRLTCISKSAEKLSFDNIYRTGENLSSLHEAKTSTADVKELDFAPGEYGTKVNLEPIIGPDGGTMDFNLLYRLRVPASKSLKVACLDVNVKNHFVVWDGRFLILKSTTIPVSKSDASAADQCVVIVFRANLINSEGHLSREGFCLRKLPPNSTHAR